MIRAAKMGDIPEIVALLVQAHAKSRYAADVNVDEAYTRRLVAQLVQRNGGTHDGGSLAVVAETDQGSICGVVLGLLDRVYSIGDQLVANDLFLVANDEAPAMTSRRLLAAYLTWADRVPDCYEINLSWTDVIETGERMGEVYARMGFRRAGEIWKRTSKTAMEAAA